MVTFKVDFDKADSVEDAIKASCGRDILFFKHWNGKLKTAFVYYA